MDPILFWTAVALQANRVSHTIVENEQTGPVLSARALAIVHLAMYDAFAGVAGNPDTLPAYLTPGPVPGGAARAAVAAAAHATLSELFPSQKPAFDLELAKAGDVLNPGHAFGLVVADAILADRAGDPGVSDTDYRPSPGRGRHRADPDNPGQGYQGPFYGARSKLFGATIRHDLDPPPMPVPPLGDPDYISALRQVRRRGIAPELMGTLPSESSRRTAEQTLIGVYWAYDGASGLGTPPRLYNQVIRTLARDKANTAAENARLFTLVNVAMADAGILSWEQKYRYDLWRPVLGIREHDKSMGPGATQGSNNIDPESQPDWLPLAAPSTNLTRKNFTPNFPAYPSGHATFGAAAFHITRLFYGPDDGGVNKGGVSVGNRGPDNLFDGLTFVSEEHDGINVDNKGTVRPRHVREFEDGGLWQMIIENGRSRVYLGVHWMFDAFVAAGDNETPDFTQNVGGVPLGVNIAEDIFQTGMMNPNP